PGAARVRRVLLAIGRLVSTYVVGYALGAIQLLPWIDFARLAPRAAAASFDLVAGQSVIGLDWLLMIMPYIYGAAGTSIFNAHPPHLPHGIYVLERSREYGHFALA